MIVLIIGGEKVGKTTLALELINRSRGLNVHTVYATLRRPQPLDPNAYLDLLKVGCRADTLVVMDRGWPDEAVYGQLLNRPIETVSEAWAEWCLGDVMRSVGTGIVLAPNDRREALDDTDIQLDYQAERDAFIQYGVRWGYPSLTDWHVEALADSILHVIEAIQERTRGFPSRVPPEYVGPGLPRVLLVGESRNERVNTKMGWAAMTSRFFQPLVDVVPRGTARTNADRLLDPQLLDSVRHAEKVVALGRVAHERLVQLGRTDAVALQHPSYVFRWKKDCDAYLTALAEAVTIKDADGDVR